jgi:YfiH family protein
MLHAYRNAHVTFLRAANLDRIPGIVHAFSTRRSEDADLSLSGPSTNGARFLAAVGMAGWPLARMRQVHSNAVHRILDNGFVNDPPEGDAACTSLKGMALGVVTADCLPILIADQATRTVGVAHAGWRGTSEGVVRKTVDELVSRHDLRAEDLRVAIGPHIGVCCMEVGEEIVEWFGDPGVFERRPEWRKPHLDLAEANRRQLEAAGVVPEHVHVSTLCTRCRADLFHSYRRDGDGSGRMLSVIGMEP